MATTVRDKDIENKAEQAKDEVKDKAKEAGNEAKDKAEDIANKAGKGVEALGEKIREKGPDEGVMGKATSKVANALETSGEYLQEKGLKGIGEDITEVIRNNPVPAVLISLGVGYLLAKATGS